MSALIRFNSKNLQNLTIQTLRNVRYISTSQKKRDTATINQTLPQIEQKSTTVSEKKNWVSWGFDYKDEATDRNSAKSSFFFSVTLCIVWGTFIWAYLPDPQMRDWAQREGFLELRRREMAGVDLVSPNYIEPSQMVLPSDEELGTTEIII